MINVPAEKKTCRWKPGLSIALGLALLTVGIVLDVSLFADHEANSTLDPAAGEVQSGGNGKGKAKTSDDFPKVNWDKWLSINPSIVGWVTVEGTPVDHPIVAASEDDPERWLHTSVYGSWSAYGVPYLEASCSKKGILGNANNVILGHHMNDGSVFSAFSSFTDCSYVREHSPILLQTPDEKVKLTVSSVERVNASDATFDPSTHVDGLETCVTFVTCSYTTWANERTLVHCKILSIQSVS